MARFKYNGEKPRPGFVKTMGHLKEIRIPLKDGTKLVLTPPGGAPFFPPGQDIGHDITDDSAIATLVADTRYTRTA